MWLQTKPCTPRRMRVTARYRYGDGDGDGAPPTTAGRAARSEAPISGKDELHRARGPERAMRKIAVVEAGERKHAHGIQRHRHDQRHRRHADPDHADAGQVHGDEGRGAQPVDAVLAALVQHIDATSASNQRRRSAHQPRTWRRDVDRGACIPAEGLPVSGCCACHGICLSRFVDRYVGKARLDAATRVLIVRKRDSVSARCCW